MEKTVLVVSPAEERHKEKLERAGKGRRFVYASPQTASEEMIEAADVIIGNVKPEILTKVSKNSPSSTGGRGIAEKRK